MKRIVSLSAVAVATLAFGTVPIAAQDGGRPLDAMMSGAEEVPGPGDEDGSGTAEFRVNPGQNRVCYTLTVDDIEPATAAHIHTGAAGEAGPPVVFLTAPSGGNSSGCADVSRDLARDIIRNPEAYYVNVHNDDFPDGAVRGQLGG